MGRMIGGNYYAAMYDDRVRPWRWMGWMQYGGKGPLVYTPQWFATKTEALAAIKAQHPPGERREREPDRTRYCLYCAKETEHSKAGVVRDQLGRDARQRWKCRVCGTTQTAQEPIRGGAARRRAAWTGRPR